MSLNQAAIKINASMQSSKDPSSLQLLQHEMNVQQDLVSYLQCRQTQYQQELKDAPAQHREFVHGQLFEVGRFLQLVQKRRADVHTCIAQLETEQRFSSQKS